MVAVGQQVAQPLGQHPGLARAGGGDDAGRPAGVGDGGQLVGRQRGRRRPVAGDGQAAGVDGVPVDDRVVEPIERLAAARRRTTPACRRAGRRRPGRRPRRPAGRPAPRATRPAPPTGRRRCWPTPGSAAARGRTRSPGRARRAGGRRSPAASARRRRCPARRPPAGAATTPRAAGRRRSRRRPGCGGRPPSPPAARRRGRRPRRVPSSLHSGFWPTRRWWGWG